MEWSRVLQAYVLCTSEMGNFRGKEIIEYFFFFFFFLWFFVMGCKELMQVVVEITIGVVKYLGFCRIPPSPP